ncbi:hypothetical protein MMC30_007688 [Trapelia coarctata]|nr:hypothetical protein [Trapelia coarctata]
MEITALLRNANKLVDSINPKDPLPLSCVSQDRINELATATCLRTSKNYIKEAHEDYQEATHKTIVWIEAFLRNPHGLETDDEVKEVAAQVQQWVVGALSPPAFFAPKSVFDINSASDATSLKAAKWRLMAVAGLRLLSHLHHLVPGLLERSSPDLDLVTCLASFTDERDLWTRSEALEAAEALLNRYLSRFTADDRNALTKLLIGLLQTRVRPHFAKSKSNAITDQGRKSAYPQSSAVDASEAEVEIKPWKFREVYIVTVFRWILLNLTESTIQAQWPLVISPLLSLLDDEATESKIKGCELLGIFLKAAPSSLLQRTGLGEIFQDSLMPCLSYLPTLTPEEESVRLLSSVYPTLITLIRRRYATATRDGDKQRIKALDKILRVGILNGYAHAVENVTIATLLVSQVTALVNQLGIASAKHLKHLIPLLSDTLSAPFGLAHPPLLKASALALQAIILNDWPRIAYYRGDILRGITACWCGMQDDGRTSKEFEDIRVVLKQGVGLLKAALDADVASIQEIEGLLGSDTRLGGLGVVE